MQRKLERAIRKQKTRILIDETTGDKEKLLTDQIKLQRYRQEYARFSKAAGLRTENERTQVAGFGRGEAAMASAAAKTAPKIEAPAATKNAATGAPARAMTAPSPTISQPAVEEVEPIIVTNTPVKPEVLTPGCVDVTQQWFDSATPNSHQIEVVTEFVQDGVKYVVDGDNVVFEPSESEKKIASLLERTLGGEIRLMPRINKPEGIQTPDYLFRQERCELKTLDDAQGKNAVYNRLNPAQRQAANFVIDITNSSPGRDEMLRQTRDIFTSKHARGINTIIVVENDTIIKIYERNK